MASNNAKAVGVGLAAVLGLAGTLVTKYEGRRYYPYRDVVGVLTVCDGHTGPGIIEGRGYTDAECNAFREADMLTANAQVRRCLPMPMLRQVEAALTDAAFNLGPRVVCGSTLQRKALANDWPGACEELSRWDRAGGRVMRGLTRRRTDDRGMCRGYQ